MSKWRAAFTLVQKGGHFGAVYVRSGYVSRRSSRVREVNQKLTEVAKSCKGKRTSDGSFQTCVRDGMKGFHAGAP